MKQIAVVETYDEEGSPTDRLLLKAEEIEENVFNLYQDDRLLYQTYVWKDFESIFLEVGAFLTAIVKIPDSGRPYGSGFQEGWDAGWVQVLTASPKKDNPYAFGYKDWASYDEGWAQGRDAAQRKMNENA